MSVKITTIQIEPSVRKQLKARGRKGQTYPDVIKQLLNSSQKDELNQ